MEDFDRQKIVWGEISDRTKFCVDLKGEFVAEATTFIMTGDFLLYLLAFLNSKFSGYIFSKIGTTTGVGTVRWKKFTIEQLRIPTEPKSGTKAYEKLVLEIIDKINSGQDYFLLTQEIDKLVYDDFGLSVQEIQFIDSQ
jgi:adenine-specific DNA-methyltransferase